MKKYKIETHCHSAYSFDCNVPVESVAQHSASKGIDFLVLNDHDRCGLTPEDRSLFTEKGIHVLSAIEFTTQEGIHIIGIHPAIKTLEQEAFHYSIPEIMDSLTTLEAFIILPHPCHETGLLGQRKVSLQSRDYALSRAHFIETDNYRYGPTKGIAEIREKYPRLRLIIGSDAHSSTDIGAFQNVFEAPDDLPDPMQAFYASESIEFLRTKKHGRGYWRMRKLKKSSLYQSLLKLFPAGLRRKIKNRLFHR